MIFKKTPEDFGKSQQDENGGECGDFKEANKEQPNAKYSREEASYYEKERI